MKVLIIALFLHFIADFLLQSREMGKNKSTNVKYLVEHLLIQFLIIALGLSLFIKPELALGISGFNAVIHGLIDWNIWRGYKALVIYQNRNTPEKLVNFQYWEDHYFYATIGLDQFLHTVTLIILTGVLV